MPVSQLVTSPIKAHGLINGATGTLLFGLNVTTSRTGTGTYTVTFSAAMPNANYIVTANTNQNGSTNSLAVSAKTTAGFTLNCWDNTAVAQDWNIGFSVNAP